MFRHIFGFYLAWHFMGLIPHADELFGDKMPYDPVLSPTYNFFPNILTVVDAKLFVLILMNVAIFFALGIHTELSALVLWYGWAALLNRNVLITNPGIPYVGWLLLVYASGSSKSRNAYWFAWFLMGLGYTVSGIHKLQCPSWIDGTALQHILEGPLGRDNFITNFMLTLPPIFLQMATWGSLFLEISFLPLGMFYHTRKLYWFLYIAFHLGILMTINFADLTIGVLMIHLFVVGEGFSFI